MLERGPLRREKKGTLLSFVRRGFGPPGSHHSKLIQHSSDSIYGRDEREPQQRPFAKP
jgi:hypothetical protein